MSENAGDSYARGCVAGGNHPRKTKDEIKKAPEFD